MPFDERGAREEGIPLLFGERRAVVHLFRIRRPQHERALFHRERPGRDVDVIVPRHLHALVRDVAEDADLGHVFGSARIRTAVVEHGDDPVALCERGRLVQRIGMERERRAVVHARLILHRDADAARREVDDPRHGVKVVRRRHVLAVLVVDGDARKHGRDGCRGLADVLIVKRGADDGVAVGKVRRDGKFVAEADGRLVDGDARHFGQDGERKHLSVGIPAEDIARNGAHAVFPRARGHPRAPIFRALFGVLVSDARKDGVRAEGELLAVFQRLRTLRDGIDDAVYAEKRRRETQQKGGDTDDQDAEPLDDLNDLGKFYHFTAIIFIQHKNAPCNAFQPTGGSTRSVPLTVTTM